MEKEQQILYKSIENKTIAWFKNSNEYLVLENTTANILKKISKGISVNEIAIELSKELSIPLENTIDFILDLEKNIYLPKTKKETAIANDYTDVKKPTEFEFTKYYKINNIVFKVSFSDEIELSDIHPKFSHLEIKATDYKHEFEIFTKNSITFFYVDTNFIGAWSSENIHFFHGKFSMQFIEKIHQKEENEWMGVFHASAISNGKKSMLFLGDSGNGKSTSLALLQANGFTCLADDFVPMDAEKQEVYSFPASISIKKNSLDALLPIYPELKSSAEYHFKKLNKVVRYLQSNNTNLLAHLPCNDVVFIKYEKNSKLICNKISKIDAFQQLIPDSWISPKPENAAIFLDWFSTLNCYQLTYSNNEEMIQTVSNIFKNDL